MSTNCCFSAALNWGVSHTKGDFVLSLNPDVIVKKDFVAELVEAIIQEDEIGIVAPKLLQNKNPALLDSTGLFIDQRRRPFDRGQGEPDTGQYDAGVSPDPDGGGETPDARPGPRDPSSSDGCDCRAGGSGAGLWLLTLLALFLRRRRDGI